MVDPPQAGAPRFGAAEVQRFLDVAGERLEGDWLLIGGALAAVWLGVERRTEDIDMVGLGGTAEERIALMDLALGHGWPVETVNSAADFFVRRVPGWRDELELLHRGPGARILRPSPTLFLLLKLSRLSEADLGDCLALLARFAVDAPRVRAALDALPPGNADLAARRAELRSAL